jgi:hypothetical protein
MLETILTAAALYFPPARFDYPYKGELIVRWVNDQRIREDCTDISEVACVTFHSPERCNVTFNVRYMIDYDIIMRHEQGHCNGWPNNHPR